jgi:protein-disulfide isomerase
MSKQFAALLAAIVLVFIGIFVFTGHKSSTSSSAKSNPSTLTQHIEGSTSSGVTLVEYGDFQCPFCEEYFPTVRSVTTEFKDQIQFQFRNFPLVNLHQNAFAAARAGEAAAQQNKFFPMFNALYDAGNWQVWTTATDPTPYFSQFAQQIGLNVTQFKADYGSSKVNDLVRADMAKGNSLNIQGTPTFFLDGKMVTIPNNIAAFEKVIKAEIAKKAPAVGSTTTTTTTTPSTDTAAPAASAPAATDTTTTPTTTTSGN